ncbi:MAG: penicillin-binding protein activator [Armatimonadota bacterium]|nr:penicillin-binding protein activator [Armatimonadota bacterium]
MMRDSRSLALGAVLVATLVVTGCGPTGLRAQESVTFGVLVPLTSGVPSAARAAQQGAQLAADEVGGERSAPTVSLLVEDDRGSPEVASRLFAQFAERDVSAVVGPLTDLAAAAVAPAAERAGIALVTPGATGTIPYSGSSVFRTSLPAQSQARVLAEYVVRVRRLKTITVIHEGNDYGTMTAMAFAQRVADLGGEIVGTRIYRDGDTDFTRYATGAVGDGAEAVFIAGYPDEGARIIVTLRERGFRGLMIGSDALYSRDLVEWARDAAHGLLLPAAFVAGDPLPRVQEFVGRYTRRYGQTPDHFAAQAYDAVKVLAFAVRRSGRSAQAIRGALQGVRRFPGATGEITFDRFGAPDRPVAVAQVKAGAFEVVRR